MTPYKKSRPILPKKLAKVHVVSQEDWEFCVNRMYLVPFSFEKNKEIKAGNSKLFKVAVKPLTTQEKNKKLLFINKKLPSTTKIIQTLLTDLVNEGYIEPGSYLIERLI